MIRRCPIVLLVAGLSLGGTGLIASAASAAPKAQHDTIAVVGAATSVVNAVDEQGDANQSTVAEGDSQALVTIIGACSNDHQRPAGLPATETTTSTVDPTGPTVSPAPAAGNVTGTTATTGQAGIGLDKARRVMAAIHSYSYRARSVTTSAKGSSQTSDFVGRAVLPDRVSYQAATGMKTFEIVRIGPTTYRRDPGRPWQKLAANKNPPAVPTATLLAVLNRLGQANSAADGTITGTLSAHEADQAGLASGPGITKPVTVTLKLDDAGHVVHFEATVNVTSGGAKSILKTQTDFADFDRVPDITAPG